MALPTGFNLLDGADALQGERFGDNRAAKQPLFYAIGNVGSFVKQFMRAGVFQRFGFAADMKDGFSCFPVVGQLNKSVLTKDTAGVVQNCPGAVFGAEENAGFRFAGEDVLPFHTIRELTCCAPDIRNRAKQPAD